MSTETEILPEIATRPSGARPLLRRAAAWVACVACAAGAVAAVSGCAPVASGASAARPASAVARVSTSASADAGCEQALNAVATYGAAGVEGKSKVEDTVDEVKVNLILLVLDAASRATGDPEARQTIGNLADAYLKLKDTWSDAAVDAIVTATSDLRAVCKS